MDPTGKWQEREDPSPATCRCMWVRVGGLQGHRPLAGQQGGGLKTYRGKSRLGIRMVTIGPKSFQDSLWLSEKTCETGICPPLGAHRGSRTCGDSGKGRDLVSVRPDEGGSPGPTVCRFMFAQSFLF